MGLSPFPTTTKQVVIYRDHNNVGGVLRKDNFLKIKLFLFFQIKIGVYCNDSVLESSHLQLLNHVFQMEVDGKMEDLAKEGVPAGPATQGGNTGSPAASTPPPLVKQTSRSNSPLRQPTSIPPVR